MPRPGSELSDFEADLARLDEQHDDLSDGRDTGGSIPAAGSERETLLLVNRFHSASLRGDLSALWKVHGCLHGLPRLSPRQSDLCLLKAYIEVKLHRFSEAEITLRAHPSLDRCREARLVRADVHLQLGRYPEAREEIETALAEEPTWDALARLARLEEIMGAFDAADLLLIAAEDELTAKQMRTFAWIEVQRAALQFNRGRHDEAMAHCCRAQRAYSGYWLVEERLAEVLGATGRFEEARTLYQRLYAAAPRPEWERALGDLLLLAGDPASAHAWKSRCLEHFLESAARGEVHFYSHLVDLCCELDGRTAEAVRWARADERLRSNFATQADLAWALCRDGESQEALTWIGRALASGAISARLLAQAACIHAAAGLSEEAATYLRRSTEINPAPARASLRSRAVALRRPLSAEMSGLSTAAVSAGRGSP